MAPMQWQTAHIPLAAGMDTKADERALEPPKLAKLENAQFEEVGGLQKRSGYAPMGLKDHSDGSDIDFRRVRAMGKRKDELLLYAEGRAWSFSSQYKTWLDRGRFESVLVDHKEVAHQREEQIRGDRAQLGNVILYAWQQLRSPARVSWELVDATTGATINLAYTPTVNSAREPKCRAVGDRLHLYYLTGSEGSTLIVRIIDPSTRSSIYATTPGGPTEIALATNVDVGYDVTVATSGAANQRAIVAVDITGAPSSYRMFLIQPNGDVLTDTTIARAADTSISCSYQETLRYLAVARRVIASGTGNAEIRVDWLDVPNGFGDVASGVNILAKSEVADHSTQSIVATASQTATVIWSMIGPTLTYATPRTDVIKRRLIGATSALLTIKTLALHCRIGSRAVLWDDEGTERIIVYALHDSPQQPMYVLLDVGFTAGDDIDSQGGGGTQAAGDEVGLLACVLRGNAIPITNVTGVTDMPQIEDLGGGKFASLLGNRRRLQDITQTRFTERGLEDVIVTMADPRAYRGVEEGDTLYIPGGYLANYSGRRFLESEFLSYPELGTQYPNEETGATLPTGIAESDGAGNRLDPGATYNYKLYWEKQLDNGETQVSSFAQTYIVNLSGTNDTVTFTVPTLPFTDDSRVSLAVFRTENDPGPDAPFYRCSGLNPNVTTGNNAYVRNDPSVLNLTFIDAMSDNSLAEANSNRLITQEADRFNPGELGQELDHIPPPAPTVVAGGQSRLFTLDPSDKIRVWYSKIRNTGEGVQFNDALALRIPQFGGKVTALNITDSGVVVFSERAIYMVHGQGPNNLGAGPYPEPQQVVNGIGCIDARSVLRIPAGVFFKSHKGIYLLGNNYEATYVGAPVEDYNGKTIAEALDVADRHQARFVLESDGILVYDYLIGEWSIWPGRMGKSSVMWQGKHVLLEADGPWHSQSAFEDKGVGYPLVVETGWIKLAGLQGFGRARRLEVLGEERSNHSARVRVAYDYDPTWVDDRTLAISAKAGKGEQFRLHLSRPKCEAVKVRIEDTLFAGTRESYKLTALSFEIGIKPGLMRLTAERMI